MLQSSQLVIGVLEAGLIASLLIFNVALLAHFRKTAQNAALALLKQHLSLKARVRRDGQWVALPATLLVPHDAVPHARSRCVAGRWQDRNAMILFGLPVKLIDAVRRGRPKSPLS
jgi:hypothetical protein